MKATAKRQRERGSVLVLALLVTLIILGIGLTVMWVASSGSKMSGNITRRQEALYVAEAGIERARDILNTADWTAALKGCTTTGTPAPTRDNEQSGIGYILCTQTGTIVPLERMPVIPTGTSTDTAVTSLGGSGLKNMNYTVWIRDDWGSQGCVNDNTVCGGCTKSKWDCDGDGTWDTKTSDVTKIQDKNARVVVRSEGVARDGISIVTLEAFITKPGSLLTASSYSQAGLNAQGSSSATAAIAP